jgi:hypothetical protein
MEERCRLLFLPCEAVVLDDDTAFEPFIVSSNEDIDGKRIE